MRLSGCVARALAVFSFLTTYLHLQIQVDAIDLDPTNPSAVKDAAKKVAADLWSFYGTTNNGVTSVKSGITGLLTYPPYYWWEAGAMFGQLIDYWYYTGDSQYNDAVRDGILYQIGDNHDLMPANQSKDEGNDDQLFWAFTVMSAAELNFENPPPDKPGWLALAQSVFNQLVSRWDESTCNGGVRWQIYEFINGFNYKNTPSNGGMFQLGARLAKYTGNDTYAVWANKVFDWMLSTPLIDKDFQINDGMDVLKKCSEADHTQWTYNYGIMIGGCAYMYNYTNGSDVWKERLSGFLGKALNNDVLFPKEHGGKIMVEVCEPTQKCDVDQYSFKAYLARWLALCAQIAPFTKGQILPYLQASAVGAAKACEGDSSGVKCGSQWFVGHNNGDIGAGQSIAAMSVIAANLVDQVAGPYSAASGGTSKGDPGAGSGDGGGNSAVHMNTITTADKGGAGVLTFLALAGMLGGAWFMISE